MNYRTETYFEYLKLHSSDIFENLKKNRKLVLFSILLFVGFAITSLSITVVISVFFAIILFNVLGYSLVFYLFPMTLHYKIYKRTSQHFKAINQYILTQKIDTDIDSNSTKVSISNRFKYYGESISEMIDYDFEKADVFETQKSIFIFPISKTRGKELNIIMTEYLPPIRFQTNGNEKIPGVYDMYTITDFKKVVDNDNITLDFQDKKYKNDVRIIIKNDG